MPQKRAVQALLVGMMAGAKTFIPPGRFLAFGNNLRYSSHDGLNYVSGGQDAGNLVKVIKLAASDRLIGLVLSADTLTLLIKYSDDFGVTWTDTGATIPHSGGNTEWVRLFEHSGTLYACSGSRLIGSRSTDSGVTWTPLTNPNGTGNWYIDPFFGGQICAFQRSTGMQISADGGATWAPSTQPLSELSGSGLFPSGRDVLVAFDDNEASDIAWSDDGTTWNTLNPFTTFQGFGPAKVEYCAIFNSMLYNRNVFGGFFGSNADGTVWQGYRLGADSAFNAVDWAYNDNYLVVLPLNGTACRVTNLSPLTFTSKSIGGATKNCIVWHPNAE
jgi:hypothetical protein